MTRSLVSVAVGLAVLAFAAPARAGDVAVGIVPPDGWTRVDAKGTNLLAAWREPGKVLFYQNLTLGHDDTPEALATYVVPVAKALQVSLPGSTATTTKITICQSRAAYDLAAVGRYNGVRVRIEEVITDIGGKKFIGTYTRAEAAATSPAAEAALHSICPKP